MWAAVRILIVLSLSTATAFVVPARRCTMQCAPVRMQESPGRLELSKQVRDLLRENDLKDPTTFNDAETDKFLAGVAGGSLAVFFVFAALFDLGFFDVFGYLLLSTLVGGGVMAYAQLRRDQVGDAANTVGSLGVRAADTVTSLNEKYEVVTTVRTKADEVTKKIKAGLD